MTTTTRTLCNQCVTELTSTDWQAGYCTQCGYELRGEKSMWEWANSSPVWLKPRHTVYFLIKRIADDVTYRRDKRGRVITYRTREQAIRIQNRLNARQQPGG